MNKMEKTKPSAPLLYPNFTSFSEQYINDKILANKKINKKINIINILEIFMKLKIISIIRN